MRRILICSAILSCIMTITIFLSYKYDGFVCKKHAESMNANYKYSYFGGGCFIERNNQYYPLDAIMHPVGVAGTMISNQGN